jgi:hypothetical protein
MKGYKPIGGIQQTQLANYFKGVQHRVKKLLKKARQGNFVFVKSKDWLSPVFERIIKQENIGALNFVYAEILAQTAYLRAGLVKEIGLCPMFVTKTAESRLTSRLASNQIKDICRSDSIFLTSPVREDGKRNLADTAPFIQKNAHLSKVRGVRIDTDTPEVTSIDFDAEDDDLIDLLVDAHVLAEEDFFATEIEQTVINKMRPFFDWREWQTDMSHLDNRLLGFIADQMCSDYSALSWFFNDPDSKRLVIYPESSDLLEDIANAEYHVDGLDLSACLKNFMLMIPEGFEFEGVDVPSVFVSICIFGEQQLTTAEAGMEYAKSKGGEITASHLHGLYKGVRTNFEKRRAALPEISEKPFSPKYTDEQIEELIELELGDAFNARTTLSINFAGETKHYSIPLFTGLLMAEAGDKRAKKFVDTWLARYKDSQDEKIFPEHLGFNSKSGEMVERRPVKMDGDVTVIAKLVASVMVYINALGDEVLHRGVPFKKENAKFLSKGLNPTDKKEPDLFTLRGPKGYTGRKQGAHYRRWHFRTLKNERFYKTGEWAGKPIGSRVVFVRDSFVNKEICPHVLTDGTDTEEKVIAPEDLETKD